MPGNLNSDFLSWLPRFLIPPIFLVFAPGGRKILGVHAVFPFGLTHLWLVLAVVLFIGEVFSPTFVLMCFGLGCCCSALASAVGFSLEGQVLAFALGVALSFFAVRPVLLRFFSHPDPDRRTNAEALVGKPGVVLEAVGAFKAGRVRVGSEDWRALPADHGEFAPEDRVTVSRIEGSTLYIKPQHSTVR
ncbi:MAG: NfeD family protein [Chthoniobacteraceae bacterium]|nr:NfeD family protein [Chthoniobacteraceae bacterium]